jgi:hypothetical protein
LEGRRRRQVGEDHVEVVQPRELDHGRPVELAVVGSEPDLARLLDDGARDLDLAVVEVAQRAVGFDAADADQADVDLELAHEVHRGFAHDALVGAAHQAAGDDHLAVGVGAHQRGDMQVVGDHAQAAVMLQLARHRLDGGADVHDQRATVGHPPGHGARDARLGVGLHGLALAVGDVLGGRTGLPHAAMEAREQAGLGQALHVAPHGLQRDAEALGQGLDGLGAVGAHFVEQLGVAGVEVHRASAVVGGKVHPNITEFFLAFVRVNTE